MDFISKCLKEIHYGICVNTNLHLNLWVMGIFYYNQIVKAENFGLCRDIYLSCLYIGVSEGKNLIVMLTLAKNLGYKLNGWNIVKIYE